MSEGKKDYYTITEDDLDCIGRLSERALDPKLRAGLMRLYGEGGELAGYLDAINACDVTDGRYCTEEGCFLCAYPTNDSLLTQIYLTIRCYERGRFCAEQDNYHSVLWECWVSWRTDKEEDPDIPF